MPDSQESTPLSQPRPPSCPHTGTGDWILRAAFSHLKGEPPKDFRRHPISIPGGQCFQTARAMLFPHTVWVREAATLCRSQMYPQHKELGTEPWKLNLLAVEGRRQMLLLPCWFWFASSMQNGIPLPPSLCDFPFSSFRSQHRCPFLRHQSYPDPCLQEPPPYPTDRSLALKLFSLQYLGLFICSLCDVNGPTHPFTYNVSLKSSILCSLKMYHLARSGWNRSVVPAT